MIKEVFAPRWIIVWSAVTISALIPSATGVAEKQQAVVTQVLRDVRILPANAPPKPASLNDVVRERTSVRTGGDSRAELTFSDSSLTRLGANTIFSFGQAGRDLKLTSGAVLLCAPAQSGTVNLATPAVSAGISGGVAMVETHKNSWIKVIIIEGQGVVTLKSSDKTLTLSAGQMIVLPPGAKQFGNVQNIDLQKLTDNSVLIHFAKLPAWVWALIEAEIARQQSFPPSGGLKDPTGSNAIDQRAAVLSQSPAPTASPRPTGAPASTLRGKP
jgi:FecR protein